MTSDLNKQMTEAKARLTGFRLCSNCLTDRRESGGKFISYASNPKRKRWVCRECVETLANLKMRRQ